MPLVCEGHVMLARDSTYSLKESAQVDHPNKMDNSFVQESLTWDVEIKKKKCWKSNVSNKIVNTFLVVITIRKELDGLRNPLHIWTWTRK